MIASDIQMKNSLKTMKRWFLILLLAAFALSPFLAESAVGPESKTGTATTLKAGAKHKHKKHRKKRHRRRHHRRNHRPARRKKLA
jgi:Ni/Co efflux regulator RcnB